MPKVNQLQVSDATEFRLPFPPKITAREIMSNKKKGKKASRPPNAFIIYRKVFSKELAKNYRFQQMRISSLCASSWKRESADVKEYYHKLAHEVDKIFLQDLQNDPQLPPSLELFSPSQLPSPQLFPLTQPFLPSQLQKPQLFSSPQPFLPSQPQPFPSSQSQPLQLENMDDYLKYFDEIERLQESQSYNTDIFVPIQSFVPDTCDLDIDIQQLYYPIYEPIDFIFPEEDYPHFQ
ncbi:hypothetical protein RclHR1_01720026 [Rhizophagus clarus]|uniref:HMG box domain-containing protein n=1 Tax=Rhizophagus clarus TaxID=94130 RepID=A0A2Z6QKW8_9GLOM|nr:hypothetical protein RclHR1_01720026 [Rhizophagus clarus]GES99583.1 hypothetical protein GLOIN_2v1473413 [Rhizophagus clarus]